MWYEVIYCLQCIKNFDYMKHFFFKMFVTHLCMKMVLFSGECKVEVRYTFYALSFYINSLTVNQK
jgi:hypothetical protein